MKRLSFDVAAEEEARSERIEKAGASIQAFLKACGYTERVKEEQALALWPKVISKLLGPSAAEFSSGKEIREGQLIVEVKKAAWRHRLSLEVPALIRSLNDELGSEAVTSIRLM
jgi:hypothetical protein